jgi:NAD(P)-dependent dehydrogenase (short-subunit alcohol dehydrogenase family)
LDLLLKEDIAVVVGGANGIGRAIATEFAAEQARVAVVDVSQKAQGTAEEIGRLHDVPVRGYECDATDETALRKAAAQIVYAAGIGSGKFGYPFWNLRPSDWPRVLDVNLIGAVNTAHTFAPQLTQQRRGTFLFISSIAGQIGSQTDPPYSAAKAGLINFAQCVAKDVAPYQVRANTLCPGMVPTAINRSVWQAWYNQTPPEQRQSYDQWAGEKVKRVAPLGRWQSGEDIAALAVFLASPRAGNITGQTMNVDGGQVMHW